MPTYEFECSKCKNRFDVFQKMSDKPVAKCPACGGKADRLIGSGSGIIFKGTGFYETDYKQKRAGSKKSDTCHGGSSDSCKGCPSNKNKR